MAYRCLECVGNKKPCPACATADEQRTTHQRTLLGGQVVLVEKCPVPCCRNVTTPGRPCRACRQTFGGYLRERSPA